MGDEAGKEEEGTEGVGDDVGNEVGMAEEEEAGGKEGGEGWEAEGGCDGAGCVCPCAC